MKKSIYFILMGCALLFIASCGGNNSSVKSSLPANDYLGNLPAILDTYYKADSVIKADFEKREKNIKSEKDLEKYNEYREERKQKTKDNEKKRDEAIVQERGKVAGKKLAVESQDPRFEVLELKIKDIDSGGASIEGTIRTKQVITKIGLQFVIQYDAIDIDGHIIKDYGIIYVKDDDTRRKELPEGIELSIESYLNIGSKDVESYSKFAKIVFKQKN